MITSLSYIMYLYLTQMKRYKIHGKCIIDTDTRYLLKMYLDTRYKILFTYLRYVSRYLCLRYPQHCLGKLIALGIHTPFVSNQCILSEDTHTPELFTSVASVHQALIRGLLYPI